MRHLADLMGDVNQSELARRMGGGVTAGNVNRWINDKGGKMTPGRFATAVRALGEDPAVIFANVINEARDAGLVTPGTAIPLKKAKPSNVVSLDDQRERAADRVRQASEQRTDEKIPADTGGDETEDTDSP